MIVIKMIQMSKRHNKYFLWSHDKLITWLQLDIKFSFIEFSGAPSGRILPAQIFT